MQRQGNVRRVGPGLGAPDLRSGLARRPCALRPAPV